MSAVTNKMICAAHDVTMKRGVVLSHEILAEIYVAMAKNKREWVGLTDEEVSEIINREIGFNSCWGPEEKFARAIEQALKEKNT